MKCVSAGLILQVRWKIVFAPGLEMHQKYKRRNSGDSERARRRMCQLCACHDAPENCMFCMCVSQNRI